MQTIQQQRAMFALERVQQYLDDLRAKLEKEEDESEGQPDSDVKTQRRQAKINKAKDQYKSYTSALPAMIHINGLGQAAAFYKSKGNTHKEIYQLLSDWLTKQPKQPYINSQENDLITCITASDMHTYRLAQAEAQALMDWVKKFAEAYLSEE